MRFRDWLNRSKAGDDEPSDARVAALVERARALPKEVEPERDLFAGIANRIGQPELDRTTEQQPGGWRSFFPRPLATMVLASSLVAASVLVTLQMTLPSGPPTDAQAAKIASMLRERDGVADVHTNVVAILDAHRAQLPPETVAAIEDNLRTIDRAIAEIHLALEANPDEHGLTYLLAEAYRREANLLERLVFWTATEDAGKEVRS